MRHDTRPSLEMGRSAVFIEALIRDLHRFRRGNDTRFIQLIEGWDSVGHHGSLKLRKEWNEVEYEVVDSKI